MGPTVPMVTVFQSTLSVRRATTNVVYTYQYPTFQSTLSVRRATVAKIYNSSPEGM